MATSILTEKELRIWAQDRPELNPLLDGVRFTSEDIEQAQVMVVDYFNMAPPPTFQYTVESFPSRYLLMTGVWGYLLRGAAIQQASNHLAYSADGVSVDDNAQSQEFSRLGNEYWNEFKQMTQQFKINQNVASVFGTKNSEYARIARTW